MMYVRVYRIPFSFFVSFLLSTSTFAQERGEGSRAIRQPQTIGGNLGVTVIDGKPYYLFTFVPELRFGKLKVGVDLNIRLGEDGKIRKEDFDETYDYFRILRFVQWGEKKEPVYARLGALDYTTLGHGFIVYKYRNNSSYDRRKIGVTLDADLERYGFESMYSDVGGRGVLGIRPFFRPWKHSSAGEIPILSGLEVGGTFTADFHQSVFSSESTSKSSLVLFGVDVGLPLISSPVLAATLYSDVAKFVDFGTGSAVGLDLVFNGLGVVTLGVRYERRFLGDQFLPSYFDAFYERERGVPRTPAPTELSKLEDKISRLKSASASQGYYGEVTLQAIGAFQILGSYYSPLGVRHSGTIHLEWEAGTVIPGILFSAGYDKRNVGRVFTLDHTSLLYLQFGYKPLPFLVLSVLYEWTYKETFDERNNVRGYEPQKRVEPKVGIVVTF